MCEDKFTDYNLFFKILYDPICKVDVGEDYDLSAFEGAKAF